MGYLNHTYLYQGYFMDILFQSARGPCSLESLVAPSGPGRHGPLHTIVCHCYAQLLSFSHRQAPQTRFAPPNCHSHWLISYTLLSFLPDSSAGSASPCGNLALRCWQSWCGMVGVLLPRRKRGIKGKRPSTLAARPTYRMGVGEGAYSFCTPSFHRAAP